jgi:O-antigen/teichoic acid export membrane protein
MSQHEIDYRLIRRRAEEQLQRDKLRMRRIFFAVYLFMFVLFMAISWVMYLSSGGALPQPNIPGVATTNDPITGAMVMLSTLAFMGVIFQMVSMIVDTKAGERQMRERAYGRMLS